MTSKHKPICKKCNSEGINNQLYVAYYCKKCNVWLEETCDDPKCSYCKDRPDKPLEE